jgi:BASS family bile acid:Na+ symporter
MKPLTDIAVPVVTFAMLTSVGMHLQSDDFVRAVRQRVVVLTGLLLPILVLPLVAIGLIQIFDPPPAVAGSLLLVAACPIGGISNFYSALARASAALSVTLTGLSCLLAAVTIPALGAFYEGTLRTPLGISAPLPLLLGQLVVILLLPVTFGMWLRRTWPAAIERLRPRVEAAALIAVTALMALIVIADLDRFVRELPLTVPLAAVFVVLSFGCGWWSGVLIGADARDRFTLAAEFATRNVAVAIAIAVTLLHRAEFATFATTYLLAETPLLLLAVYGFRARLRAPVAA